MKKALKKLSIWAFMVAMIVTVVMPATSCLARPRPDFVPAPSEEDLAFEALTPAKEKEQENWYWSLIFMYVHTDPAYYKGADGFNIREEISYAAAEILEEGIGMPESFVPGDANAKIWQEHWGNFFYRLEMGKFSRREMRKHWRIERRRCKW